MTSTSLLSAHEQTFGKMPKTFSYGNFTINKKCPHLGHGYDHDLASFSTKADLAGASFAKKFVSGSPVCTEGFPATEALRPPDLKLWASPSVPLPFDERAPALKGVGADAATASRPPSIRSRLREAKWGKFKDPTIGFLLVNLLRLRLHALAPYLLLELPGLASDLLDRSVPRIHGR
ncbi:hypothetical protein Cgig2_006446 [Carnegiea gigantea]|uniref:Uncharacterized protein n=1 Tax=Carnegiea gigantea TaxID=171969 RepID=A0A9Q1JJC9_9CARY|nr:hypothetical protein Cgig2_006446 [Carnegiea gigantea]